MITTTASPHNYDGTSRFARASVVQSTWQRCLFPRQSKPPGRTRRLRRRGALMEKVVDLPRGLGADAGDLGEIGKGGALDRLERPEMVEQRALAGRPDAGNLLQAGLADIAPPPHAVGADGEAMRLVAQPLHEVEHRIARLELEWLAAGHEEGLEPGIALRPLGDADQRH